MISPDQITTLAELRRYLIEQMMRVELCDSQADLPFQYGVLAKSVRTAISKLREFETAV